MSHPIEVDGWFARRSISVAAAAVAIMLALGGCGSDDDDEPTDTTTAPTDEMAGPMGDVPHTDVRLPPVLGFYENEEIFFIHSEASDADVAGMLTDMMDGSPVLVTPGLASVPADARDDVYVFTNGVMGDGPFGFQPDVFPSAPGDDAYSPLRRVVLATWRDEGDARELRSAADVLEAEQAGDIDLDATDVIVNMPFLTWPGGQR